MKRLIIVTFFIFVFFCQSLACNAVTNSFCENTANTVIVFGNGIMTTKVDAKHSLEEFKAKLRARLTPEEYSQLEFELAYNHTYGFMSDLYESLRQKLASDNFAVSFWRWMGGLDILPDSVRDTIEDQVSHFDVSGRVGEADLANHIALYRTSLAEGKKVILVAHSQGIFFANAAYQILYFGDDPIPMNSFGIVSVANPASFVGGNGPYTTLNEDLIIGAIAAVSGYDGMVAPLPPNITNNGDGTESGDSLNHSFIDAYLVNGSRSEQQIFDNINSEMASLVSPNQTAQDGVITVTLTWGSQPDVDLHVFEPDGTHVYYANKNGTSGYLDMDDTDGFGPEHYYVGCGTLEVGTYRVGINYYYGTAPTSAIVQIKAGDSIRSYTINLPQAFGSAGNSYPVPVADITVTGDALHGFSFDIHDPQGDLISPNPPQL